MASAFSSYVDKTCVQKKQYGQCVACGSNVLYVGAEYCSPSCNFKSLSGIVNTFPQTPKDIPTGHEAILRLDGEDPWVEIVEIVKEDVASDSNSKTPAQLLDEALLDIM